MTPRKLREIYAIVVMLAGLAAGFYPIITRPENGWVWTVCLCLTIGLVEYGRHVLFENEEQA